MRTYVIVGAGARGRHMFAGPLFAEWADFARLAGVYDLNRHRAELLSRECGGIPVFPDMDEMLKATKPDVVIVATIDSMHDYYIIRALEAGCDVISEKPLTINAGKLQAILEAERRTGRQVTVTFNARFMPYMAGIKKLLKEGVVGRVLGVNLEWHLDRVHGADYFRRWHRHMDNSGGLLVHKSTHHFDLVNWWLDAEPVEVSAMGELGFYGPKREERGERCQGCSYRNRCEFYFDIAKDAFNASYYRDAEAEDGYYRDQCVFSDDTSIYDTMSLGVQYDSKAILTYSLTAYSPYEGWKLVIHGVDGRLEAEQFYSGGRTGEPYSEIAIYHRDGEIALHRIPVSGGSHSGGDERLRSMLFGEAIPDPLGQQAGTRAGALSMLIGAAANISIAERRPVTIGELMGGGQSIER
ncbi:Gfo/Idh/MocA family oxidoreductase [Paenibacillus sp. HB172176]|uniref:Gfo/Idh/MocA family protein n=1 Tax=Paenibacillus sp. HB172176 TaxID=2493690 RepID=UPI00143B5A71|nr:Gfo/Idh/MocA family oxidoreductase [Paenibacillus sp. HB172176]